MHFFLTFRHPIKFVSDRIKSNQFCGLQSYNSLRSIIRPVHFQHSKNHVKIREDQNRNMHDLYLRTNSSIMHTVILLSR